MVKVCSWVLFPVQPVISGVGIESAVPQGSERKRMPDERSGAAEPTAGVPHQSEDFKGYPCGTMTGHDGAILVELGSELGATNSEATNLGMIPGQTARYGNGF